jgi:cell division protease FtsH
VGRVLGDKDGRAAVEEVLQQQKLRAKALLDDNRHLVVALRDALLERHELIGTEITDVLEQAQQAHAGRSTRTFGSGTGLDSVIDLREAVLPALPEQATGPRDTREPRVEPAG